MVAPTSRVRLEEVLKVVAPTSRVRLVLNQPVTSDRELRQLPLQIGTSRRQ
jgi:hypothetical protein